MLPVRIDKLLRVGSGLGLLLLLAAQEKVCPWLFQTRPGGLPRWLRSAESGTPPAKKSKSKSKSTLPHIMPDAPAPRWRTGAACMGEPGTGGDRADVASRGPAGLRRAASTTDVASTAGLPAAAGWRALLGTMRPHPDRSSKPQRMLRNCLALDSSITPTGPPRS